MIEFVVTMEHRPGQLASLAEALAAVGVNIEALAAYGHDGDGTVRLIVQDAVTTRRVLTESALHHEENTVLAVHMPHRPGELARVTRSLADSGVNIESIYVLHADADGIELAVTVDEPEGATPLLEVKGSSLGS